MPRQTTGGVRKGAGPMSEPRKGEPEGEIKVGAVVRLKGKMQRATVKAITSNGVHVRPTLGGFHYWQKEDLEVVANDQHS